MAVPEILIYHLTADDNYISICSDGVFEFLSNQEVIDIIRDSSEPIDACRRLVSQSYHLWLHNEVRTDDITSITLFLSDLNDKIAKQKHIVQLAHQKLKPTRKQVKSYFKNRVMLIWM